jgi:chromate transport protein ChrA
MSATAPAQPSSRAPNLLELFTAFALISLYAFGGVLAWSRRMLVEERKWMTPGEFNDAYALCQFLPGPNVVNLSVVFGRRIRGLAGAFAALWATAQNWAAAALTLATAAVTFATRLNPLWIFAAAALLGLSGVLP